ncbi:MAG: alpha/beta hydrolase [Gemmatimonadaceae bacterium]
MANQTGLIPGRIPPEEMFPAGDARFRRSFLPITVSALALNIRAIECGNPAEASVVLCVHGWACSVYSFRRLMPLIAELGMRAVAIDLPGHGLSSKPTVREPYTLDSLAECVIKSMDELGVSRCVLVGHSMGGPICARVAVLAPERVSALVLLAPAGSGTELDVRVLRSLTPQFLMPLLPHLIRRWMIQLVFAAAYGSLYRPTSRDIDEYWAPSQFPTFVAAMSNLLHYFEWSAGSDRGFGEISVPVAIMDGGRDNLVVRRWVQRYAEVLPNAVLTVIEDCGHVVPEEAPEAVIGAIRAMIR